MADYKVVYTMLDGNTITNEIRGRGENFEDFLNNLVKYPWTTHISQDRKQTVIINNRNVLHMEVTEI